MATCITKARSNYFSVTDVPAFLTIMQKWEKDFGIRIMKKRIDEDQTVYAFSYETTSVNINDALCDLQKILPEWEAVIIQEIAYEQSLNGMMRYVIGKAIIITYNAAMRTAGIQNAVKTSIITMDGVPIRQGLLIRR